MTAIVAVKKNGKVCIASDSMGSSAYLKYAYGKKLIEGSNFIIGYSGGYRTAGIIEDNLDSFKTPKRWNLKDVRRFAEWLRQLLIKHGAKKEGEEGNLPRNEEVWLILATKDKIFWIEPTYSTMESKRWVATGSGREIVEGAAHALYGQKWNSRKIAEKAIRAACDLSLHCGQPIHVMDLSNK